ncbi:hypothetical protein AB1N83_004633 [Pleurotus pulmonarius]
MEPNEDMLLDHLNEASVTQNVTVEVLRSLGNVFNSESKREKKLRRELKVWLKHPQVLPLYGVVTDFRSYLSTVCPWMHRGNLSNHPSCVAASSLLWASLFILPIAVKVFRLALSVTEKDAVLQEMHHIGEICHHHLLSYVGTGSVMDIKCKNSFGRTKEHKHQSWGKPNADLIRMPPDRHPTRPRALASRSEVL